ncbi:MAG: squalene/phytoene synthase family protein [Caulobacterales bacterium]|uniref:squalene/phytoene synthase family protein n=1 Tax=Glycocaulis sp. TaxID=1969725 RepID=UPI003FA1071F
MAETLADMVRQHDQGRYLACLFAPEDVRSRLFALYAFDAELAAIAGKVSEPVIGEMRLAWARDALADLFADPPRVRRHPVYEALASLRGVRGAPDLEALNLITEARQADLGEGAFPDAAERERYVERVSVLPVRLAARLCAPDWQPGEQGEAGLRAAGRLLGYARMLRDFAGLCAAGRPPLTEAEMDAAGVGLEALRRGLSPERAAKARASLLTLAIEAAQALTETRAALPLEVFPALGHATLARSTVKRAGVQSNPFQPAGEAPLFLQQWRLLAASLSGRV